MSQDNKCRISNDRFYIVLTAVLLFCYTFNFLGKYKIISYILLAIVLVQFIKSLKISKSLQSVFVIVFGMVYAYAAETINNENKIQMIIQCFIFYFIAIRIAKVLNSQGKDSQIFTLVYWAGVGFAIHAILTTFTSNITLDRRLTDFSDGYLVAATQLVAWCVCLFALIPWTILRFKTITIFNRLFFAVIAVLALVSSFIVSSRTGLLVFFVALVILLFWSIINKKKAIIRSLIIGVAIFVIIYTTNGFNLQSIILNSNLSVRLMTEDTSMFETPRTERWEYVLNHLKDYPNGGYHYSNIFDGQMHSIVLDLYDECGAIVTILFILILFRVIWGVIKLIIGRRDLFPDNIGMVSWFIIVCVVLFSEPIWSYGRYMLLAFVFFVFGIIEYYAFFKCSEDEEINNLNKCLPHDLE